MLPERVAEFVKFALDIDLSSWKRIDSGRIFEELAKIGEKESDGEYEVIRNSYKSLEKMVIFDHIWIYRRGEPVPEDELIIAVDLASLNVYMFRNPEWKQKK